MQGTYAWSRITNHPITVNKHSPLLLITMTLGLVNAATSAQQVCHQNIPASTPVERFHSINNGYIIDQQTKLVWQRCSLGQQWDDLYNTCRGEAKALSWLEAKNSTKKVAGDDAKHATARWRLPTIYELSSIVELRCENPAINLQLFPATPASHYWTATTFINRENYYWLVQFKSGESHIDSANRFAFVRFVKTLTLEP